MRGSALLVAFALVLSAGQAHAQFLKSYTYLHSGAFASTPVTDGGGSALSATLIEGGTLDGGDFTSDVTAIANATAQGGHIDLDLTMTTVVDAGAPQNRRSTFVLGRSETTDTFHIGAGTSGLANGAPVQVELQVEADGWVSLGGAPSSDASECVFRVSERYTAGNQVELAYNTIPPGSFPIDPPRWYVTLDTTIGGRIVLDSFLRSQIGGQVYTPGAESTDRIWFDADMRLAPASGFEDIEIVSDAGAPIEPLDSPPVAEIAVTTEVPPHGGDLVQLDGSGSFDPDGGDLTYQWTLLDAPPGSAAALSGADTVSPSFIPDELGTYRIQLIVVDDEGNESEPALLTLTAKNLAPTAVLTILTPPPFRVGTPVELDASASSDPDGDDVTYQWILLDAPPGSAAVLSGADTAFASFVPDQLGSYQIQLIALDAFAAESDPVTATVSVENQPPTAVLAPPTSITVHVGTPVQLDGSASSDPDGDDITTYLWTLTLRPEGSAAVVVGIAEATLTPDLIGVYLGYLTVFDAFGEMSAPAHFTVTAENEAPTAVLTIPTSSVHVGTPVELDAGGSFDPDVVDDLSYAWEMTSTPEGSTASISGGVLASFTPDRIGTYSGELIVTDEFGAASAAAPFSVEAYNLAPVASAGPDQAVGLGAMVTLDGSESGDPDGDPLDYSWTLANPDGSSGPLSGAGTEAPRFRAESLGDYVATLVVSDPWGEESAPDSVTVSVTAPNADIDDDGVPNTEDNCPLDANADQADWNGDGYGDLCTVEHCVADSDELQLALDHAEANGRNDVIQLVEGLYWLPAFFDSSEAHALVIRGGYEPGCLARSPDPSGTRFVGFGYFSEPMLDLVNRGATLPFGDLVVQGITVEDGSADEGAGIRVEWLSGARVVLEGNVLQRNRSVNGSGGVLVWAEKGEVLLRNNVIVENVAREGLAAAAYLRVTEGRIDLTSNTIAGNESLWGAAIMIDASDASEVQLRNNIVWENSAVDAIVAADLWISLFSMSHAHASYNDWNPYRVSAAFTSESGTITMDPLFADPGSGDYHLSAGSPCVDEIPAAPGPPQGFPPNDIEGDPRPLDGDGDGVAAADIGADEFVPPQCSDGVDNDGDGSVDFGEDPGCSSASDVSEVRDCRDGIDNDGDGWTDWPDDPGCRGPFYDSEEPECQDGIDNDGDDRIDFDGGASAGLPPVEQTDPDPQCLGVGWTDSEGQYIPQPDPTCGVGAELALLLPPLIWLWVRRRRCSA